MPASEILCELEPGALVIVDYADDQPGPATYLGWVYDKHIRDEIAIVRPKGWAHGQAIMIHPSRVSLQED